MIKILNHLHNYIQMKIHYHCLTLHLVILIFMKIKLIKRKRNNYYILNINLINSLRPNKNLKLF